MWTDTPPGQSPTWYGINSAGSVTPKVGGWAGKTVTDDEVEFDVNVKDGMFTLRSLQK